MRLAIFFVDKTRISRRACMLLLAIFFIIHAPAQQSRRLNTGWEFVRQDLGGVWEAVRPVKKGNPEEVPLWTPVVLPHCFNARDAVDPDVNYYQGPGWYRTQLDIDNPYAKGRTILHFEGSGQKTELYVYTTKIGAHTGGYDEFSFDITDAVEAFKKTEAFHKQFNGRVPISIRVDNSRDLEMIPSDLSDFTIYGGIYRYLNLVYLPPFSIEKLFAKAVTDSNGRQGNVEVNASFYDPLHVARGQMTVSLIDPLGKQLAEKIVEISTASETAPVVFQLKNPKTWSPGSPTLYTVRARVSADGQEAVATEKIGFRYFEFADKGPFRLNGKRLLLRGTHRHEDHAGVGAAMTEEMMRAEMLLIKDMGVNFIRLGHYQQSRLILDLCDSLGILVWEEIPWCRGGLGGETYKQQGRRMLTNMIGQHYNHPSIIVWGLGNENDWPGDFTSFQQDSIRAYMKELNGLAHALDPSRKTAIRRCDFCRDIVDVYSPTIWAGWYRGIYTEYKKFSRSEFDKVNHFLHVEWGGDSHAGRHSEKPDQLLQAVNAKPKAKGINEDSIYAGAARQAKDGDWNESYVCNLIDWHLKEQETMPWLTGTAQWSFKDFATPIRPDNPVPYVNQKGVVERDLTRKEAYYVFQSYWSEKPMAHIYGHAAPVRWGEEGETKMVKVYSNCDEAEVFINGRSAGVRKRNSQDYPAAGLRWNLVFQKGENKLLVVARSAKGGKSAIEVRDSISFYYQTEKWGQPAKLSLQQLKEEDGIVTLEAKLLDGKNLLCLDAANWIRFSLAGDGEMVDDLGTSSGSRYLQLYNGRALIRVRTRSGHSVVGAKVDGVETVFVEL